MYKDIESADFVRQLQCPIKPLQELCLYIYSKILLESKHTFFGTVKNLTQMYAFLVLEHSIFAQLHV